MPLTQHSRILNLLRSYNGDWCPLPKILDLHIAQYGTRISELRRQGFVIENKDLGFIDGERHTAFRLVSEPKLEPVFFQDRVGQASFIGAGR